MKKTIYASLVLKDTVFLLESNVLVLVLAILTILLNRSKTNCVLNGLRNETMFTCGNFYDDITHHAQNFTTYRLDYKS